MYFIIPRYFYPYLTVLSLTTPDVNTVSLNSDDEQLLPQFVEAAHNSVCIRINDNLSHDLIKL